MDKQTFVGTYGPLANDIAGKTGLDPSVVLGIVGQETGYGEHVLGNNLFGISPNGKVAQYPDIPTAGQAFVDLINSKYPNASKAAPDAQPQALVAGGYNRVDPNYATNVGIRANAVKQSGFGAPSADDVTKMLQNDQTQTQQSTQAGPSADDMTKMFQTDGFGAQTPVNNGPLPTSGIAPTQAATPAQAASNQSTADASIPNPANRTAPAAPNTLANAGQAVAQAASEGYNSTNVPLLNSLGAIYKGGQEALIQTGKAINGNQGEQAMRDVVSIPEAFAGMRTPGMEAQAIRDATMAKMYKPGTPPPPNMLGKVAPETESTPGVGSSSFNPATQPASASIITDASGKPLQVYHGTTNPNLQFQAGRAAHFTTDPNEASFYAENGPGMETESGSPNVIPANLSIKNPKVISTRADLTDAQIADAKAAGHDGIIIKRGDNLPDNYVVFDPAQVFNPSDASGLRSAGAAGTPTSQVPPLSPVQRATYENGQLAQTAVDRAGPRGVDTTEYIPGETPTRASVDFNYQNQLDEKTLRSTDPEFAKAYEANKTALSQGRVDFMKQQAGDPIALEQAELVRETQKEHDLGIAWGNKTDVGEKASQGFVDQIQGILDGPAGKETAIKNALSDVKSSMYDRAGNLEVDPEMLYGVRRNLANMLGKAAKAETPTLQYAATQLGTLKDSIDNIIESGAPGYKTYKQNWERLSQPIDTMETLQKFLQGPSKITNDAGVVEFGRVNRMMDKLVRDRQASGIQPAKSIPDETMDNLFKLRNTVARDKLNTDLANVPGSPTIQLGTNAARLGSGPLGAAVKGAADFIAHTAIAKATGGLGNMVYANTIKPALQAAKANKLAAQTAARGRELLSSHPEWEGSPY